MLAKLNTFALVGIDAVPVEVEVDTSPGLPKTVLVGAIVRPPLYDFHWLTPLARKPHYFRHFLSFSPFLPSFPPASYDLVCSPDRYKQGERPYHARRRDLHAS
jgi:hypothetical protein